GTGSDTAIPSRRTAGSSGPTTRAGPSARWRAPWACSRRRQSRRLAPATRRTACEAAPHGEWRPERAPARRIEREIPEGGPTDGGDLSWIILGLRLCALGFSCWHWRSDSALPPRWLRR